MLCKCLLLILPDDLEESSTSLLFFVFFMLLLWIAVALLHWRSVREVKIVQEPHCTKISPAGFLLIWIQSLHCSSLSKRVSPLPLTAKLTFGCSDFSPDLMDTILAMLKNVADWFFSCLSNLHLRSIEAMCGGIAYLLSKSRYCRRSRPSKAPHSNI